MKHSIKAMGKVIVLFPTFVTALPHWIVNPLNNFIYPVCFKLLPLKKFCNYKDGIKYKLSYPEAVTVCPAPIGTIIVDVGIYPSETANLQA